MEKQPPDQTWLDYLLDYVNRLWLRPGTDNVDIEAIGPVLQLARNPNVPVSLAAVNRLSAGLKKRIYRTLIPPSLLAAANIDPISWRDAAGDECVDLYAPADRGVLQLTVRTAPDSEDPLLILQLADNGFNGIDCALLVLNDPKGVRFQTDVSPDGQPTLFGTVHRNLAAEEGAMAAGLSPGQIRPGLHASRLVLQSIESFLLLQGHESIYLEPLSYVAAVLFEKRGFSYVRGHQFMQSIHREFQPEGRLYRALDGSTPFRQADQWRTVRGRAWAIHDGLLDVIGRRWDRLRMVKRVGYHAGVTTFPGAVF